MGYTRIVQYGNVTEVYEYSRDIHKSRKLRYISKLRKQRDKKLPPKPKTQRSIKRSTNNFFRLVHHNLMLNNELPILITLTNFTEVSLETGYNSLKLFFRRLNKYQNDNFPTQTNNIQFITVPELQPQSQNLHYHVVLWGLKSKLWSEERSRRLLQRFWQRGYIDVRNTSYKSEKIAGYLAKYFTKSQKNTFFSGRRAYTTSRNIQRPTAYGSNQLSNFLQHIVEPVNCTKTGEYSTMWLGKCKMSIYKR